MDPLSITASIAGIAGVCMQAAGSLDTLRSKFQNAHVTITALSSQCRAIRTGLSQLQVLVMQNHTIRDRADIMLTLDTTLTGCLVVLTCFEDSLDKLSDAAALMEKPNIVRKWWTRTRIVWNETEMKEYLSLLQGQQSAVAFLVQVLHMTSIDEILDRVRNGKGLLDKQATKAASLRQANLQLQIADSVFGDGPSKTADTIFRGDGDTVAAGEGVEFEFDNTVVNSKAYRRVMALAKEVVTKRSTTSSSTRPRSIMNLENMSFDSRTQSESNIETLDIERTAMTRPPVSPLPSVKSEEFQLSKPAGRSTLAVEAGTTAPAEYGIVEKDTAPERPQSAAATTTSLGDVLRSKHSQIATVHDIDYFDMRCQRLYETVSQWVLRFSKFSDMRACRLTSELEDEKLIDRLDNTVLDGSDVNTYLADRVKRRDVFTSMTMTMIWEFVFTRYLFGLDREQRMKLKVLEKQLGDVGPASVVRTWRAITLSLLSYRPSFKAQRTADTVAVTEAIFGVLAKILPPPLNLEEQIRTQLRRVVEQSVDLAIEMRTQPAELIMLPPLQPEYDETGELVAKVMFNSSLMNQPGGSSEPGMAEGLEEFPVRVVLFPLVVQKGIMEGDGEEEVVVFPAQVLVAQPGPNKVANIDGHRS
ncbi:hypothetical protein B0H66DRAFT_513301 [Apodospora peruviana]|uniref:Azaphilone pigments biosynthesis cluster protein L N-terminal domain-containing protein n=1 Tax=Apodospora peruviana TaxID=516989 RepID=A0AAE0IKN3_9PEZI|nr:hypothetical protein B0H66DRAFT_513301 [Apodospora peruviana]